MFAMKKITSPIAKIILMTCVAVLSSAVLNRNYSVPPSLVTLAENAVAAGNVCQGQLKVPINSFSLSAPAAWTLTGVTFNSSGTYVAADITKFQLWYSTTNSFPGTATTLSTDILATLGPGAHSF